jgi:two-component system cell cycle sensor histidine kinase/response regulator CckA
MAGETILVVEDTPVVLELVVEILQRAQYTVLHATSGATAIELASAHEGAIHLLLSDVNMPAMTGPDLADKLLELRPDIHVVFMSGFTGGGMLVLNHGWAFINKPFVPDKLLQIIYLVLHTTR